MQKTESTLLSDDVLQMIRSRNLVINGDMRIDQRQGGASITCTSTSVFAVDRVRSGMAGANGTAQRVACTVAGFPYMLQLTGGVGTTTAWVGQYIESFSTAPLVGKRLTVSFYAASSAVASLLVAIKYPTAVDNYTSTTTIESKTQAITTTLTRYTVTFTNVIPANAANGLYIELATGANLAAGTLQVTGLQLEVGVVATPFEYRHIAHEVALCQRYYYKANNYALGVTANIADGYASLVRFPVQMRANPTLDAGASYSVGAGSAGTPQLSTADGECGLMRNAATNWTANTALTLVSGGFNAEIT